MAWHVAVYDALVHAALAGFVLLALATVALWTIRQPARRIRVIELTLVGLLALPFVALIPGYPRVAVWPATLLGADDEPAGGVALIAANRQARIPAAEPGAFAAVREMQTVQPPALPRDSLESIPLAPPWRNLPAPPGENLLHGETVHWQLPRDFRFWIVLAYFTGAAAMIGWSLVGLAAVARLLRSARPAGDACRGVLREIAGPNGDRVALLVSARAAQPCALVWRRPTIVLPESLAAGAELRQLRWALAHEWSHVARRDVWSWGLSSLVRWFYFYQPLLWPLRRQLRLCQDFLADAAAARSGTAAEDYAEFLTSYSSRLKHLDFAAGLGMAGRASDLRRRIVMLVDNRRPLERAVPWCWNLAALPLIVLLVVAVTSLGSRPTEGATEPPPAGSQDDPSAPPPDTFQRPSASVDDSFTTQPKGEKPPTDREAKPPLAAEPKPEFFTERQAASAEPQPAPETYKDAPLETRRAKAVVDEEVSDEVSNDPLIFQMTQRVMTLTDHLNEVRSASHEPETSPYVRALQSQILQLEESIDERKAQLRPKVFDRLAALQDRGKSTRRSSPSPSAPPFSGRLRPGDMVKIDLAGGSPTAGAPNQATVEPDGNLALGALHGRFNVGGKTLIEAEEIIRRKLQESLKDPHVQLTYVAHNPDVVPAQPPGEPRPARHDTQRSDEDEDRQQLDFLAGEARESQIAALVHEMQRLELEQRQLVRKLQAKTAKRFQPDKLKALSDQVENLRRINAQLQRHLEMLENSKAVEP